MKKNQCFSKLCFGGEGRGKRFIKCGQKHGFNYCDFLSKTTKTQYKKIYIYKSKFYMIIQDRALFSYICGK